MHRIEYKRAWNEPDSNKYLIICKAMMTLMLNNVATTSHFLTGTSGRKSLPGCIIASPSFPSSPLSSVDVTDQDYVFHWVRDASVVATELSYWPGIPNGVFDSYSQFSRATQMSGASVGFACFRVDATARDGTDPLELKWSEQSDGPALRIISLIRSWGLIGEN